MAKNDATTNDETAKAAAGAVAAAGKAADTTKVADSTKAEANVKAPDIAKAADTAEAGQADVPINAPDTAASTGAPGAAAQPPADGVTQEDTKRRLVAIEVISRVEGFWRGDRQWTIAPQTVPLSELSKKQLAEIEDEPLLIVRDVYEGER